MFLRRGPRRGLIKCISSGPCQRPRGGKDGATMTSQICQTCRCRVFCTEYWEASGMKAGAGGGTEDHTAGRTMDGLESISLWCSTGLL